MKVLWMYDCLFTYLTMCIGRIHTKCEMRIKSRNFCVLFSLLISNVVEEVVWVLAPASLLLLLRLSV